MKRQLFIILLSFSTSFFAFAQAPVNLGINLVFSTNAILQWESGTCAQLNYTLAYKDSAQSNWDSVIVSNNGFSTQVYNLNGLTSLTTYNWRVKCDTSWVYGPNFTTNSIFNFTFSVTDASCSGSNDGAIDLLVSGGSPPYSYLWSSPTFPWFSETTEDVDTLFPGLYYIDVTDAIGNTERDSIFVSIIDSHSINQIVSDFDINPVTGYGQWTTTILQLTNTGCDVNLRPEFIISHDSINITQGDFDLQWFNPLTANYANLPYNINNAGEAFGFWHYTSNGPNPDSTGIIVNEGATQLLTIRVRFNNNPTNTANYGLYSCIWNTQEVDSIGNIIQALAPSDTLNLRFSNCGSFSIDSLNINNILCFGNNDGNASISSVSGGFGNYSYQWSNGDTTAVASNLSAGNYDVLITDDYSGCQDSTTFSILEATPITVNLSGVNVSCNGANDGSISTTISGSGIFSYSWSNGESTPNISSLSAGTYTITVYDSVCSTSFTNSYNITSPNLITYSSSALPNASCDSTQCTGRITANLFGGTQPYQYSWSNGSTQQTISNLCSGTYTLIATDVNSCQTFYDTIVIIDTIGSASLNIISNDVSCFGFNNGSAEAVVSSGSTYGNISLLNYCGSMPYNSSNENISLVRLYGDNGDNIINNTSGLADRYEDYTNQYASLTPNNSYSIRVEIGSVNPNNLIDEFAGAKVFADWNTDGDFDDANEELGTINVDTIPFMSSVTFTVPNTLSGYVTRLRVVMQENNDTTIGPCDSTYFDPNLLSFVGPTNGATEDYSIVVNVTQQPTFLWSNGATTQIIDSLAPGTYSCQLTDENNCVATDSITINEPSQIIDSLIIGSILCHGGFTTANLIVSGGTPPYTNNLPIRINAGTTSYTITDSLGCQLSNSFTVTQPNPSSLNVQIIDSISCFSSNDGSLFANVAGGTPPYTFLWTNNINNDSLVTDTITNLFAASYICEVTDSNNCTTTASFILTEPSEISVNQNNTNVLCHGDSNGVTILNIFGGNGNYTISAFGQTLPLLGSSTVSSSQFFPSGIPAGSYPFSISDASGCIKNDTILISQPNPLSTINTVNNISCYGLTDGSATINVLGGTPPFVEDWGGYNPNALAEGTYFFTVTDSNNCLYTDSINIIEPDSLYYSSTINNISCFGTNDGNVSFNINGGIPPYNENWGTSNPNALFPGTHYYTISDTNGCSLSDSVNITEPNELLVSSSITNVSCYGGNNGTVNLTISGGTLPYNENWYGFNPQALYAGTYIYSVIDTNNCSVTDTVIITQSLDSLTSSLSATNLSSCLVMDGSIDQNIIGGTPPYTYIWNNGDTTEDISNLMAGTYSVITTDTNGCFTTSSIFVDQPSDSLRLILSTQDFNGFNIACYGDTNGTISAITNGGNGLINYNWSNGDTNSVANNLHAASFSVTITDTAGCSLTDSITLIAPTELISSYSTTDVLCYGDSSGSATVTFSGGVPDYLLAWGSFTFPLINGQNIFTSGTIIPQGLYPYSATDLNGCTIYDTILINQPDSLYASLIMSDYNGFNISCEGGQDANVEMIINGGSSPYNTSFSSSLNLSIQNELDTTNIPLSFAGSYNYVISDTNGCVFSDSIILTEPTRLSSFTQLINNSSCFDLCDGSMTVLVGGGIGPYNYIWNNDSTQTSDTANNLCAGNYIVQVQDANNCISNSFDTISQPNQITVSLDSITNNTIFGGNIGNIYITLIDSTVQCNWTGPNGYSSSSEDIVNLYAGIYILNTTDSLGCSLDTFIVEEPLSLSASLDYITNNICWGRNQGAIGITADGGDSVYTYLWTGPNGFSSTNEDIDSLYAGVYTLELSDTTNTISYTYTVLENDEINIFSTGNTSICYDGTAIATAYGVGGTSPLQTLWSNGDTGITTILSVGTHAVTVVDVYGCNSTDSVTIDPGDSLSLYTNNTMVSCYGLNDGICEILVTNGGTAPYLYSDDGGLTYQNSNTFYSLSPGNHTFTVLDNNSCSNDISITITQPLELGVDVIFTNLQCFNDCNATATAIVDNGTQPYSYEWTDPNQQLNQTAINLCAGSYNVIVTDDNGCVEIGFVTINNPNPIIVNIWQYENMLEATSGFVSYQWLDSQGNPISGETSNEFFPISSGEYSVEVIDSNGCIITSLPITYSYTGQIDNEINLKIYPNPTSNNLFLENTAKISEIEIYNALGEKIIHHLNEYSANIIEFDLSEKTRGIYFVKIISGKKLMNYKIVLQ